MAIMFAACGEDSSVSATSDDENSTADISSCSSAQKQSSSSKVKKNSSSSQKAVSSSSQNKSSSSSIAENEQSSDDKSSSSSEQIQKTFSGKVSGVSQKGPFLIGSTITLHELDESIGTSGRAFPEKIKNDKGEFEISYKELSSNYALLVADGYYRNENTGKKSSAPIKLNALSDLSDRSTVNVNLLTHLEYDRVKYLISEKGLEYKDAKAQAEKEIFKIFNITVDKETSAEDLSIFGESTNDAALLAISVLMQGRSSEGEFSERLALVAQDIEEDGTLDNEQILADIADGVALLDLEQVSNNILAWKISDKIPAFAEFVENFWTEKFSIGKCTEERINETITLENNLSKFNDSTFVCDINGWRTQDKMEKRLGSFCTTKTENNFIVNQSDLSSVYVCKNSQWISTNRYNYDALTLNCDEGTQTVHSELNDIYYACKDGKISTATFDMLSMNKDFEANIWNGAVDSKVKINETESEWFANLGNFAGQNKLYNSKGENFASGPLATFDEDGNASTLGDKGILASYEISKNSVSEPSYVSLGFDTTPGNQKDGIDITDWEGLCVVYASSTAMALYVMQAGTYNANFTTLPASKELTVANIKWEDINKATSSNGSSTPIAKIIKKAQSISIDVERNFYNNLHSANEGVFYIAGIGKYNGCSIK